MKKTIPALLLCLLLIACALSVSACENQEKYAPNGLAYKVNDDHKTCTITGIGNCTDTVIEIPEKIGRYKVTVIGENAFYDQTQITEVTFPDGLVRIEASAFEYTGITMIVIPDTVTDIGVCAFQKCQSLKSITLPQNLTVINDQICYLCSSLESIVIPDSVTVLGDGAFAECPLRSVTLGSGIEKIEQMALLNLGTYGSYPLTVTYNGTLAQWESVDRADYWIQEIDCTFSCLDFSGDIMDVYN